MTLLYVNYGKKAQLKIQQTAFMLIAVTLFFVLAGIFMLVFGMSNLKDQANIIKEKNALLLVSKLANSPEFSCGESFGTRKSNCVDADKLIALKANNEKYSDYWNVENIEIRKIYPIENEKLCTIANYPNCNIIRIYDKEISGYSVGNFVSLCRKESSENQIYDKCEIAKLIISYNSEQ